MRIELWISDYLYEEYIWWDNEVEGHLTQIESTYLMNPQVQIKSFFSPLYLFIKHTS
ncbi:predicted protein [Botrytis cinerea T4]|uniref:Uncharacterized protein n=1 Tax=Botryotinia fuckeliana (strain T4) TaxID=999810 RepID=G2YBL6_BOTF4|nr:predicted protein [Botrytis cinerea T4]